MSEALSNSGLEGTQRLLDVVDRLRGEGGCPWDREQTLTSLKPYLIEECYELLDAIDEGSIPRHLEELGDVLLQVVLHSRIRKEEDAFSFDDVAGHVAEKLVRRHPHVFADLAVSGTEDVLRNWESIKASEKGKPKAESIIDGIPRHLPALQRAQRVQARAANVGFDWECGEDVLAKVEEELGELREALVSGNPRDTEEELGDLFFALVNFCRFRNIQAEMATHAATQKFLSRFRAVVERIDRTGRTMETCTLQEMDVEWNAVKAEEKLRSS